MKAALALSDGTVFWGRAFGAVRTVENPSVGEVVFNTSMYGYQEILTDPSYAGQTICFTYPHIGNVGCNEDDYESAKIHAAGVIVRELSPVNSNFRSQQTLSQYLLDAQVMGLCEIDTRALVSHIRDQGAQMGAMAGGEQIDTDALIERARSAGSMLGKDYVPLVSCTEPYTWNELPWSLSTLSAGGASGFARLNQEQLAQRPHVVAVDCGIKRNILRLLLEVGFRVTVVPAATPAKKILEYKPDALFLSNGPGDPATLGYIVQEVRSLVGRFPIFGICLGHQILGMAFGAKTSKLKFGHRGGNHPVKDLKTGKVEITVQNHGFTIEREGLKSDIQISHLNLNDHTIEGLDAPSYGVFSVQYHPEASPGPHDSNYLFKRFFEKVVTSGGTL